MGRGGPVSRSSSNQYGLEKRWRIGVGHEQEKGEKQFTNMVDSSYVGLFLYQNIFKGLKKKKKGGGEKTDWCGEIKKEEDFQEPGVSWR